MPIIGKIAHLRRKQKAALALAAVAVVALGLYGLRELRMKILYSGHGAGKMVVSCTAEELSQIALYRGATLLWKKPQAEVLGSPERVIFKEGKLRGQLNLPLLSLLGDPPPGTVTVEQCDGGSVRLDLAEGKGPPGQLLLTTNKRGRLKLVAYKSQREAPTIAKNIIALRLPPKGG